MLNKNQFLVLTVLGALSVLLAIANMIFFTQNRAAQAEAAARAQYIQQSAQLEPLYRELIRVLADLAMRGDNDVREMLGKQGITMNPNAQPGQPSAAPTAPAADAKKGTK